MKTNKQVKRLIAIFLIALGIVIGLAVSAQAQTEIAYKERLIKAAENARLKTDSVFAKELLKLSIPILSKNKIHRYQFRFYVEKKQITKKGKLRKLRKKQIRQIERN